MTVQDEAREILHKAVDVIHARGWMRGRLTDGQRVCALGAVYTAAGVMNYDNHSITDEGRAWRRGPVGEEIRRRLDRVTPKPEFDRWGITEFNDKIARDADDVCHKLKEAAEL